MVTLQWRNLADTTLTWWSKLTSTVMGQTDILSLWYEQWGGLPGGASCKEPTCQCRRHKRCGLNPWARKIPWRRARQFTSAFLPRESHGERSLAGYSPQGHKELTMTEVISTAPHMNSEKGTMLFLWYSYKTVPTEFTHEGHSVKKLQNCHWL